MYWEELAAASHSSSSYYSLSVSSIATSWIQILPIFLTYFWLVLGNLIFSRHANLRKICLVISLSTYIYVKYSTWMHLELFDVFFPWNLIFSMEVYLIMLNVCIFTLFECSNIISSFWLFSCWYLSNIYI